MNFPIEARGEFQGAPSSVNVVGSVDSSSCPGSERAKSSWLSAIAYPLACHPRFLLP